MKVRYSPELFRILKNRNVRIRKNFKQRIKIFSMNPNEPLLNNHALKRNWQGYKSIDITSDWRAVYKEINMGDEIIAYFVTLGTHDELYRNLRK